MVQIKYLEQYLQACVISVLIGRRIATSSRPASSFRSARTHREEGKQCLELNISGHNERALTYYYSIS